MTLSPKKKEGLGFDSKFSIRLQYESSKQKYEGKNLGMN